MTPAQPKRSRDEIGQLGRAIFDRVVKPRLTPEEDGKYVAIDIATEEYEIDDSDYEAIVRLSARHRGAQIWLVRVGHPAAYKFGLC
jgi:hypothetical protein